VADLAPDSSRAGHLVDHGRAQARAADGAGIPDHPRGVHRSQAPADQMREIRDLINEHKGVYADPYEDNEL
jgi:hypothetical protein